MLHLFKTILRQVSLVTLSFLILLSGFPSTALINQITDSVNDRNIVDSLYHATKDSNVIDKGLSSLLTPHIDEATAATYQVQTGYYIGNGGAQSITGLGFRPDMILLKANTTAGVGAMLKTSAMPAITTVFLAAATTNDDTATAIRLDSDGFTVTGANSNNVNVRYTWTAFTGSDCSVTGTFCVGSYTGNGAAGRLISSGFQPSLAIVKRTGTYAGSWRTLPMAANVGQYFSALAQDTAGALFTTISATGFNVGASVNNVNAAVYYYVAFKGVPGSISVGTYTGTGVSRSVTGVGFQPDFMFTKNASAAISAVYSLNESDGDNSSYFIDTANLTGSVQGFLADGFQVGTNSTANGNTIVYFYVAFGGTTDHTSSGTFNMASGSYTGTGQYNTISGLTFAPDLIIIKSNSTSVAGVFRTRLMGGDSTAYLDSGTANVAGAITSLNSDGFTVYTHANANALGVIYHWQAFGGAWNPTTNSGSSDFYIGAYYGNGIDNRNVVRLPFQAEMVTVKSGTTASAGVWRSTSHTGDISSFFATTADVGNNIQTFNTDGFQIGTTGNVNTATATYFYFGFRTGANFKVGSYVGNGGDPRSIGGLTFQPELVWVKQGGTGTAAAVFRPNTLAGDLSLFFTATARAANNIQLLEADGFQVGSSANVNTNTATYRWCGWNTNTTVGPPPSYQVQTGYYIGNGGAQTISGLGFRPDAIILKSNTTGTAALLKTSAMPAVNTVYLGVATNDLVNGAVTIISDGFAVATTNANTANVRYTWTAFAGSDCSVTGTVCVGSYTGNGAAGRLIATGFNPSLALVKRSGAYAGSWRSSSMAANVGQYFSNTAQDTTGALFTTISATGFNVGAATNNVNTGIYYFVAFKGVPGSISVGTYTGTGAVRSVTGVGFQPDFMFTKNTSAAVSPVLNLNESDGNYSSYFTATANLVNSIQALQADGFQVGTDATANGSGIVYFYAAFGGTTDHASSGTFKMATGSYTGTGQYNTIAGLTFAPDLVIVKSRSATAVAGVFRTRMMAGDNTSYLDAATGLISGAITSLNSDGFTVYTHATTNTSGTIYDWQAFGGAWSPVTNSGSSDFYIGAYYGNGVDNRNVVRLPFQAEMLSVKRSGATAGVWRSTSHTGDISSSYAAAADVGNNIQTFNTDGFQVGTTANVNTAANLYFYFGFRTGTNFKVGSYVGNGVDGVSISGLTFQPELVWVKQGGTGTAAGVFRPNTLSGDLSQFFVNTLQAANHIQTLMADGFQVGNSTSVNTNASTYRWCGWNVPAANRAVSGILTSAVFNTTNVASRGVGYNSIMWQGALGGPGSNTGAVRFQIATADANTGPWNFVGGANCSINDWFDPLGPNIPVELKGSLPECQAWNNKQYVRYKVQVCSHNCTDAGPDTPTVTGIILNWSP